MKTKINSLPTIVIVLLAAHAATTAIAQNAGEPPMNGPDAATLQKLHPSRPGYRHTVTPISARFYNYITDKRSRGEPLTTMENATIIMMVANRTWPVPPAVTEADKAASNWIDTHDTRTSNSLVIGAHAASGRIDYDASTPGIERFREFFHSLPPERRTGSAQLMMNYYMSMGFDMRSNEQRKADEKLNMPKVPTPEEKAKAERDKANADDAAQAERDRKVFDGIKAMDRLRDKIKQSKEEPVPEVAAEEKKVLTTPDRGQNPDQDDMEPEQPTGPEVIEGPGQPPVDGSSGGACDGAGSCGD